MLIECDMLPGKNEIPSPQAARHHPHLEDITVEIPTLEPQAAILLLLGRDVIQAHKVLEQIKSNQFYLYSPKSQSHCLSGLYNLYSEQHPLSLDPRFE